MKNNYQYQYSLEELVNHINEFQKEDREDILFNLGGVINHNLYFLNMSPNREKVNEVLLEQIKSTFGSYESFKKKFKEKALSLKGSGYTFLVIKNGKLEIINLQNQETPYQYGYLPLITLDMWEHAYYINYENKKDIYIDNFFEIVDYKNANKVFYKV